MGAGGPPPPPRPLWIIAGCVYDLSTLDHPGPPGVIPATAGTDCTDQFFSYHAMVAPDVWRLLRRYRVPDEDPAAVAALAAVPPGQRSRFSWAEPRPGGDLVVTDPMYLDLRARLAPVLRGLPPAPGAAVGGTTSDDAGPVVQSRVGSSPPPPPLLPRSEWKATPGTLLFMAILFVAWLVTMRSWLAGNGWSVVPLAVLYYFFNAVTLHDATHHSLFTAHWANSAAAALFGGWHCLPAMWMRQHVEGHHGPTNTVDDPDVHHFDKKYGTPLGWRVRPEQAYHPVWWVSLPAVLPMASLDPSFVRAAEVLVYGTYMGEKVVGAAGLAAPPVAGIGGSRWALPSATRLCLAAQVVFFVGLAARQLVVHGVGWGSALVVLPHALHGAHYYMITQVNHLTAAAAPGAGGHGSPAYAAANPHNSWVAHQVLSTIDWCPSSAAARVASGGLNAQVLHHLLPSVHPSRFGRLQGVLEAFCADHGLPYRPFGSYWEAMAAHFRYLGEVNARTAVEGR
ncbi:hypothetical protein MMPV_007259 [Pyropia vietnamensis]